MPSCMCSKRLPCLIHKDKPLEMPDIVNESTYVINIFSQWSTKEWYYTVAKDAIRYKESERFKSKTDCLKNITI